MRLYELLVMSILLYGAETWSMTVTNMKRLEAGHQRWHRKIPSLVGWLLNGTPKQKGQFVPTAGEGNRLSRLRMANEIQCI